MMLRALAEKQGYENLGQNDFQIIQKSTTAAQRIMVNNRSLNQFVMKVESGDSTEHGVACLKLKMSAKLATFLLHTGQNYRVLQKRYAV